MECHVSQCCAHSIVYPPFCVYYAPVSHLQSQNGHLCWKCFAVPNGRRFTIFLRSQTRLQRWSQQKWIDNWSIETSFSVTQHSLPREHTLRQIYVQAIYSSGVLSECYLSEKWRKQMQAGTAAELLCNHNKDSIQSYGNFGGMTSEMQAEESERG